MNVGQLITKLRNMPLDAEVTHLWDGEERSVINHVWLSRGGSVVTADFGMVCYTTESRPIDAPDSKEDPFWETLGDEDDE
jgi:hypothetical protein